jgi:hypothetical protein
MEVRRAFRSTGMSKWMVAAVALTAAFGLALAGGYVIKAVSLPAAHRVQIAVPQAIANGESVWDNRSKRGGLQALDGPAPASNDRTQHGGVQFP